MIGILSCIFLSLPTFLNLYQLTKEIKIWMQDCDTRHVLNTWINSNVKILFGISIISGSSFSGIEFCNSNLFEWYVCYMNLPRRYRQKFKHKRLILFCYIIRKYTTINITINLFNYIIIIILHLQQYLQWYFDFYQFILTIFEFSIRKYLFDHESFLSIKFNIKCKYLQTLY